MARWSTDCQKDEILAKNTRVCETNASGDTILFYIPMMFFLFFSSLLSIISCVRLLLVWAEKLMNTGT